MLADCCNSGVGVLSAAGCGRGVPVGAGDARDLKDESS